MRIYQQTEAKEHDDLEQPGQSIHESINLFAMHYLVVTYHNTGNVNGEVTISFQKIGNGESEKYKCKQKDGIKGLIINVEFIQHEDGKFAEKVSGSRTYYKLDNE